MCVCVYTHFFLLITFIVIMFNVKMSQKKVIRMKINKQTHDYITSYIKIKL